MEYRVTFTDTTNPDEPATVFVCSPLQFDTVEDATGHAGHIIDQAASRGDTYTAVIHEYRPTRRAWRYEPITGHLIELGASHPTPAAA